MIRQLAVDRLSPSQVEIIQAATRWANQEARVRALLLKGSLGRGEGDELSDVDLVIVPHEGRRSELWEERRSVAEALGRPLGLFREVPWSDPTLVIVFYDGPQKVDLFFQDVEPEATWWLGEGYAVLADNPRCVLAQGIPFSLFPLRFCLDACFFAGDRCFPCLAVALAVLPGSMGLSA